MDVPDGTVNNIIENSKDKFLLSENQLEREMRMNKLRKELNERFESYQKTMKYMAADAPIETLCLPKKVEKALLAHGCLRIYDMLDMDFSEVKGLGVIGIRDLTSRLDQFFSMF
jgi:hypothetical protein